MTNIICAGFGGQGVLTAGLILAKIAMEAGKEVTWIPSYGSEMRGGTANCNVKIADTPIASPFIKSIDILITMNEPSVDKFEKNVVKNGFLIVNSALVKKDRKFRDDITVVTLNGNEIAQNAENPRGLNIVMLAAGVASTKLFEKQYFTQGVEKYFTDRGRMNPKNAVCIEKAWEAIS